MNGQYVDNVYNEMLIKEANNRVIVLNEGFDDVSIYKVIYYLRKIQKQDKINPYKKGKITIRINSPGGVVYSLLNLLNVIEELKKDDYIIETISEGYSMSCAFILLLCGSKGHRYAGKYSTLLYHQVSAGAIGKMNEMKETLDEVCRLNELMHEIIIENTDLTKGQLVEWDEKRRDVYISPEEALEFGVIDKIN